MIIAIIDLAIAAAIQWGDVTKFWRGDITINIEKLITFANGFFLINVLIGVVAGIAMIKNNFFKTSGCFLGLLFTGMLFYFASKNSLTIICMLAVYYVLKQINFNRVLR